MAKNTVYLPWGSSTLPLNLPESWNIAGTLEPSSLPPCADPDAEVRRALAEPVGAQRLEALAQSAQRVVVVIDDGSRPTPVSRVLPAVLEELARAGIPKTALTLVPAIGLHRGMEADELAARIGMPLDGLTWENPDCDDPTRMINIGTTSRGTPVWVNKTVAAADLIVSIGCIEPHIIASFGGGYKNLVPGVAGRATVAHNHALNCAPGTFNMVGQPIDGNPMRQDLEEASRMIPGKVFIVNTILNHCKEVVRVAAGDPVQAHRAGVAASSSLYGVKVPRLADVVITCSHPMDQDLRQGVKALANTVRAVKPGGVMITMVRAEEGTGVFGLANRKFLLSRGVLKVVAPLLVRAVPKLKLKGIGEEDRFFLYFALQAMIRARLVMYAPTIPSQTQENLPFIEFVQQPEDAVRMAAQKFPRGAEVLVFPYGGITYPDMASSA